MEKKTIGEFISVLRKANGMTQKQLAEKLAVSDKTVSRWERCETAPDLTLIPVIAELFGITSDELLRGEKNRVETEKSGQVQEHLKGSELSRLGEKRLAYIVNGVKTKYLVRNLISMGIALIGLIVGCCCTLLPLRGMGNFAVGLVVILTTYFIAVLHQIVSAVTLFASINEEEFAGKQIDTLKATILRRAVRIIGGAGVLDTIGIVVFLCGFEPFEFFVLGPIWGAVAALGFVVLWQIVRRILIRRGYIP